MTRTFLIIAGISGSLAVALGAFGAHALQSMLSPKDLATFHTGVEYQFYHTLALIGVALLARRNESRALQVAGYLFLTGIVLFSGSLYTLTLTDIRSLGMVAPIGGMSFIVGWIGLLIHAVKYLNRNDE